MTLRPQADMQSSLLKPYWQLLTTNLVEHLEVVLEKTLDTQPIDRYPLHLP